MSKAPPAIAELAERFAGNRDSYCAATYNEAQTRIEFIDPLFGALGWDMRNRAGTAEAYKEVIHEDALKVGGATKAPDYCFRVGSARKFFVEAKKPASDLLFDFDAAFQLRRYAWSAKLPLSVLTNFREFALYDCRQRPSRGDKASFGRVLYLKYDQYAEKWDDIAGVLSRDAVWQGSFDRYAESSKGKHGTSEVDAEFLQEIEKWRRDLAAGIARRNPQLTVADLNFAVQSVIDRIIFLRMAEDRGIEDYGRLNALTNAPRIVPRMVELFAEADQKYNSGLFHFEEEKGRSSKPDTLTPELQIDDAVLRDIIGALYYPRSPYEFSVISPEILGNVYEQFLGKVIRRTPALLVKVEEKPEVKKAGGVYYTPQYIVEYIVRNTVGALCEGKTPEQIADLRIVDPACGSGSFLLGAYQYLLDYHRDWYVGNHPEKRPQEIYRGGRGDQWWLTPAVKKSILLNNIFGVDIDPQAVEVTKLSLLLKVLEGESAESLSRDLRARHARALPDLDGNIKCGNSLIGWDFYDGKDQAEINEEERRRVNAFDWSDEFPSVFGHRASGRKNLRGFDAVIGNPPYVRVRIYKDLHPDEVTYLESKYQCARHVWDIYLLMFEKALSLLKDDGLASFIVPIQTLHQPNCRSLREILFEQTSISIVADCSRLRVFQGAIVKNCILVVKKGRSKDNRIAVLKPADPTALSAGKGRHWPQNYARKNPGLSLKTELLSPRRTLCSRIKERSYDLGEMFYVTFGLRSCAKGKGMGSKARLIATKASKPEDKPYLEGRNIGRYEINPTGRFIHYRPSQMYSPRTPGLFETPKIISQTMLSRMRIVATLDTQGYFVEQSLLCVVPFAPAGRQEKAPVDFPLDFVLGVMNSRLASFYFATCIIDHSLGGGLIHATPGAQSKLPIPRVEAGRTTQICKLVKHMLQLRERHASEKAQHEKTRLEREFKRIDAQIDRLVYDLYGLSDDDIKIIEAADPCP